MESLLYVGCFTYIRLNQQWGYLSLITDAYSRKIMGYSFRQDLAAQGCMDALKMALNSRLYDAPLIHHSDRGSQYCSQHYVALLLKNNIAISMTQSGDPYENALAERVNGIIKAEFNLYSSVLGFAETAKKVYTGIKSYNELRPHASCDYLTPQQAHLKSGKLKKRWKDYHKNYNCQNQDV